MGRSTINADNRYDHGLEWFQIWAKLLEGGPEFDWDGTFFKLKGMLDEIAIYDQALPEARIRAHFAAR